MSWFGYTLLATFFYGVMNFLYKVSAEYGCSSNKVLNTAALTVSFLALCFLLFFEKNPSLKFTYILFFAFLNGTFFGFGNLCKLQALKKIPANLVFPITKTNAVFVIIISLLFFKEKLTFSHSLGIFFSILSVFCVSGSKGFNNTKIKLTNLGIILALCSAFCTSMSMTAGKLASVRVDKFAYMFLSYMFVAIYTFFIYRFKTKKTKQNKTTLIQTNRKALFFGIIIGILNFFSYFFVLNAFAIGKLSLFQAIFSTSIVIPIILSVIFYKEKLDFRKILILIFCIASILFIKFDIVVFLKELF